MIWCGSGGGVKCFVLELFLQPFAKESHIYKGLELFSLGKCLIYRIFSNFGIMIF